MFARDFPSKACAPRTVITRVDGTTACASRMCASGGPSRPGRPFFASGGPLRPGVAKLDGVALRYKGLLRRKEAAPAFNLVQYATIGRQGARQC